MAVTTRGSQVSGQAAGASSGSFTITVPSATVTGDYLLLLLSTNLDTVTAASGWTLLQTGASGSVPWQARLYGKVASATDAGGNTYSWNLSNTTAAPNVAVMWAFGNVDTTKIVSAKGAEDTTSPATTPTITTTVPSRVVHLVADRRGSTPAITWTYPAGTKVEGTNDGSVGYTVSGAPAVATTTAGSQSGINITGSANPSASFAFQVGLGDALVAVPASDSSSNIIEAATIVATVPAADTAAGVDTTTVTVPISVSDTVTGVDTEVIRESAADTAASSEAVKVLSGGSILAFANEQSTSAEAATIALVENDSATAADVLSTATIGIQGELPPGPRIVRILPATNA